MSVVTLLVSTALLVTTVVYAWLTNRIAIESRKAAEASRDSAEYARLAAEAANRSAQVAEAQLPIDFKISVDRHRDGKVWLEINPTINVWFRGANLRGTVICSDDAASWTRPVFCDAQLTVPETSRRELPFFLHASEPASLDWPQPQFRLGDHGLYGMLAIAYSLDENGPERVLNKYSKADQALRERRFTTLVLGCQ